MDRNSIDWHGQFTAIVTPFDAVGSIDEAALRRQVDFLADHGVDGIVADGCTGEFWAQNLDERRQVVRIVNQQAAGRLKVIGSVSSNYTRDVIALAEYFKDIGCDGVMMMPPFMVRPNKEDIFLHYKAVSDAVKIPIMLYNVPQDTVNNLTPDLVERLADLETVVAIKDSTFDFNIFWQLQCRVGERIRSPDWSLDPVRRGRGPDGRRRMGRHLFEPMAAAYGRALCGRAGRYLAPSAGFAEDGYRASPFPPARRLEHVCGD